MNYEDDINMVNVLTLGVRNDGTQDISAIVNEATAAHALYFPAGQYRVEKPLFLKNPIYGAGYSRNRNITNTRTWFVSAIENTDSSVGVLNFAGIDMNVENLNICCNTQECGIRIDPCSQSTMTLVDKVGIYNVRGYGIYVTGGGSRPFFVHNTTIFSSRDFPVPGVGIRTDNYDNRFTNVEIMGCRVSLELLRGFNYGSDLHLWTGSMCGHDNGVWWRGTRGIVLSDGASFNASQVYPDTCFYALEQKTPNCSCHLKNVFYWEDGSTKGCPDHDGRFFHCDGDFPGCFHLDGGEIAVMEVTENNGRMQSVYAPGQNIRNVILRTDVPLTAENLEKLCISDELPDYTVKYTEEGYCRIGDIFEAADSGYVSASLILEDGAAYGLDFLRRNGGKTESTITPLNSLCDAHTVRVAEPENGIISIYVFNPAGHVLTARFTTKLMNTHFRPVHYGRLHTVGDMERYKKILPEL